MTLVSNIRIDRLKELFYYDKETGVLTQKSLSRKSRGLNPFSKNYRIIKVDGISVYAHRAAWAYVTGSWPKNVIDHIDGNRLNNKFSNLRDVSQHENMQNLKKATKRNKSCGLLGVFKNRDKWISRLFVNGKKYHCGTFLNPEDAHHAYLEKKSKIVAIYEDQR